MRTSHVGKFEDLTPDRYIGKQGGDETLYYCPYCDDKSGHMYYNTAKNLGFCQRCNAVIPDGFEDDFFQLETKQETLEERYRKQRYDVQHRTLAIEQAPQQLAYAERRGIPLPVLTEYNVRAVRLQEDIFFCNKLLYAYHEQTPAGHLHIDAVDYYQLRTTNPELYVKHSSPAGAVKPLCWLGFAKHRITLCEGFFSALSAYVAQPDSRPVVLQGKTFTAFQLQQLHMHAIKQDRKLEILVCLDGGEQDATQDLVTKILSRFPADIRITELPKDTDPNDCLLDGRLEQFLSLAWKETRKQFKLIEGASVEVQGGGI